MTFIYASVYPYLYLLSFFFVFLLSWFLLGFISSLPQLAWDKKAMLLLLLLQFSAAVLQLANDLADFRHKALAY